MKSLGALLSGQLSYKITLMLGIVFVGLLFGYGVMPTTRSNVSHEEKTSDTANEPISLDFTTPEGIPLSYGTNDSNDISRENKSGQSDSSENLGLPGFELKNTVNSPSCYKTVIPHKVVYKADPNRYIGEEWTTGIGVDGYVMHCTDLPDVTVPAVDQNIKQGTKPHPAIDYENGSRGISYEAAQSSCVALGTSGTSAFVQCLRAYGY